MPLDSIPYYIYPQLYKTVHLFNLKFYLVLGHYIPNLSPQSEFIIILTRQQLTKQSDLQIRQNWSSSWLHDMALSRTKTIVEK